MEHTRTKKTSSIRRVKLLFERKWEEGLVGHGDTIPQCANLLQAIELNGYGDEEETKSAEGDDDSMMLLPRNGCTQRQACWWSQEREES
jgi:hypothetical protein